uniref:Sphingomyelin phosphodiesterase 4 n=1 Tax=Trichobilharzia regenti TaxID=157069 RepID=A0AA85K8T5_TRIRE|nr:unnamed protein product [Trichobilharzia regenti]
MRSTVCLSLPLSERLKELNIFVSRGNAQDIHAFLVPIVDNIFGYSDGTEGWGLHTLKESDDPHLFGCIREFLSPNGRFLEVLSSKLSSEFPVCKYDFPLWLLSASSQNFIRSVEGKLSQMHITLNAFCYYMFSFMCYTSYPKWKQNILLCDLENSLYFTLFSDYISFYLYTDPVTVNVMVSRLQLLRAGPQSPAYQRSYFNESASHFANESMESHISDFRLFWQTDTMLQAICEFLLSWQASDLSKGLSVGSAGTMTLSAPQNHAELSNKPTVCQVFLIRSFLKNFYFALFNNTSPSHFQIPQQQIIWNKILHYRKYLRASQGMIISSELHPLSANLMNEFLQFMISCFQHWPLDLSFEVVLETWLSSIQPWRYAQSPQPQGSTRLSPIAIDVPMNSQINIDNDCYPEWLAFVARHYSLYVAVFLLFLQRAVRTDLRVCRNAHMIYRVTKVFSQDGFKSLIRDAEKMLSENQLQQLDDSQLSEIMLNGMLSGEQTGLWNPVLIKSVERLLNAMETTRANLQSEIMQKMHKSPSNSNGFFNQFTEWLYSLLIMDTYSTDDNINKCISYLTEGIHALSAFFEISETSEGTNSFSPKPLPTGRIQWDDLAPSPIILRPHLKSPTSPSQYYTGRYSSRATTSPSFEYNQHNQPSENTSSSSSVITQDTLNNFNSLESDDYLTPLDRFQIIMGLKRPNICRKSTTREYASLSCTSYESRYILRVCNYLEDKLNKMMRRRFIHWCSLPGIQGRLSRQILLPTTTSTTINQTNRQSYSKCNTHINPRISLRCLANYYILTRLFLLYIFAYVCVGIHSPMSYVLCLIIFYMLFHIFKAFLGICREKIKQM